LKYSISPFFLDFDLFFISCSKFYRRAGRKFSQSILRLFYRGGKFAIQLTRQLPVGGLTIQRSGFSLVVAAEECGAGGLFAKKFSCAIG
jgi:hypothetical protein